MEPTRISRSRRRIRRTRNRSGPSASSLGRRTAKVARRRTARDAPRGAAQAVVRGLQGARALHPRRERPPPARGTRRRVGPRQARLAAACPRRLAQHGRQRGGPSRLRRGGSVAVRHRCTCDVRRARDHLLRVCRMTGTSLDHYITWILRSSWSRPPRRQNVRLWSRGRAVPGRPLSHPHPSPQDLTPHCQLHRSRPASCHQRAQLVFSTLLSCNGARRGAASRRARRRAHRRRRTTATPPRARREAWPARASGAAR